MNLRQIVLFDDEDRQAAMACAQKRVADAKSVGARDRFGEDSVESHYHGALAELAAARMLGEEWTCPSKVWNQPDVGRYEVRAVGPRTPQYVKTKANDGDTPILVGLLAADVIGVVHSCWFAGWTTPAEIKKRGRKRDLGNRGAPAIFADIYMLNPVIPELT